MPLDRIVSLRARGLRSLSDVQLPIREGLTVLIGENGAGKTTLVEAFELLRKAAGPLPFMKEVSEKHGGLAALLRRGSSAIELSVLVEGDGPPLEYGFKLATEDRFGYIDSEWLNVGPLPGQTQALRAIQREAIRRDKVRASVFDQSSRKLVNVRVDANRLVLGSLGALEPSGEGPPAPEQHAIERIIAALAGIDVRVPFETRPWWITKERSWTAPMRESAIIQRTDVFERLGENLANCLYALQSAPGDQWQETLAMVRLGLGQNVREIKFPPDASGGRISFSLDLDRTAESIPAFALSEGELTYLAFVALAQFRADKRGLLIFDEPETHLHPELLRRVLELFERVSNRHPVLLATQSDRLLDLLDDPAASIIVCEVTRSGVPTTSLARPDAKALAEWLRTYRGFGELRAAGAADLLLVPVRKDRPDAPETDEASK